LAESLEYAVALEDALFVAFGAAREIDVCFAGRPIFEGLAALTRGAMYSS
jgi:hypothetical protein